MTLTCPHCHQRYQANVGALMGQQHSEAKARAARANGRKGGDPRKFKRATILIDELKGVPPEIFTQQPQKEQQT